MSWTEVRLKGDPLRDRGDHVSVGYKNKLFIMGGKTTPSHLLADGIYVVDIGNSPQLTH